MLRTVATASLAVAAVLAATPAALACDDEGPAHQTAQATQSEPKKLEVDQLAAMMEQSVKDKTALFIFDANSDKTRRNKGVIPSAIKLSSSSEYDLALLPKNKADATVFYCAGLKCGASKSAAMRAIRAGYTNVHVMPAGISGWVKAGKAVDKLPQA